jgi:2-keto-4-pentenoate hydratase/2-oxohepta-3-ene-1,7-dioic acid hydratase in catechol pathway
MSTVDLSEAPLSLSRTFWQSEILFKKSLSTGRFYMKVICVDRTYPEHCQEFGNGDISPLILFLKPETALLHRNRPFYIPEWTKQIRYETELVLKICKNGKYIQERFAHTYYNEIGIGIDFTARDLQDELIAHGLPWEKAKAFDLSAPLGTFLPKEQLNIKQGIRFSLKKNDKLCQSGNSINMIYSFDHIIAEVSQFVTLRTGDLIFTGSPPDIDTVQIGDVLEAFIENENLLRVQVK